jgi:hypothetical protein
MSHIIYAAKFGTACAPLPRSAPAINILDDAQIEKSTLMLDDNMYQILIKCAELCDFGYFIFYFGIEGTFSF